MPEAEPPKSAAAKSDTAKARRRPHNQLSAALIFGLVGMITGSLSLYIAWRTTSEEAATVLSAFPTASSSDLTHAGFGVRTQLVNKSLRPVIVQGASLWVDGNKISEATGYLDDARLLDRSTVSPASITDERADFPISLNAREGRPVAVLMDVWRPIVAAESPEAALNARNSLNQLLTSVGSLASGGEHAIELGLDLAPGGLKRFPIASRVEPGIYPEAIRDASAIQRQAPLQNWLVEPLAEKGRLVGLSLRRRFAGGGQADLVRLDVWKERSPYHRMYTRPVLGQQAQLFPLDLADGRYVATFRLGDDVVAYRSFSVPWRETQCSRRDAAEPLWCRLPTRQSSGQRPSHP